MAKPFYGPDLAALHHRFYSEFVDSAAPGAIAVLRAHGIKRGVVLDLGCGAGQFSARLLKARYQPVGIDISAAMIRIARRTAPKASFIRDSVTTTQFPQACAAIALGEVFNYLKSKAEMLRAFRNVYRALTPGGVLIFDIKEPLPGNSKKFRSSARWGKGWAVAVEVEEDPRAGRLVRRIVTFTSKRAGLRYKKSEETHEQRIYRARDVAKMLREAGFSVRIIPGFGRYMLSPDRKILLAKKPLVP
ncbi:MAG TPA: class I SAM-dependent methyltransferase [Candidatus Angelobacter sp.]